MKRCSKCDKSLIARGLCKTHYHQALKNKEIDIIQPQIKQHKKCLVEGCDNKPNCKNLCEKHYTRKQKGKELKKELDTTKWTEANIIWIAGILEGEGCFTIRYIDNVNKKYSQIRLHMTDFDIVERVYDIVGCGTLIIKTPRTKKHKPTKLWTLCEAYPQLELLKRILPYMGKRRSEKIKQCIEILEYNVKHNKNLYS